MILRDGSIITDNYILPRDKCYDKTIEEAVSLPVSHITKKQK
ncbi:hypothetical protein [Bacillus sp. 165]|nr:hypothetical protein [Bacillus sp. 165]